MPLREKADVFGEDYNEQPGNDYEQRNKDSVRWEVEPDMLLKGVLRPLGYCSGPQVGNPYDADALGEQREFMTYPNAGGKGVKPSTKRGA